MAALIFKLSHREDEDGKTRYINYRDLTVQQLGTIYERTLEYDLRFDADSAFFGEKVRVKTSLFLPLSWKDELRAEARLPLPSMAPVWVGDLLNLGGFASGWDLKSSYGNQLGVSSVQTGLGTQVALVGQGLARRQLADEDFFAQDAGQHVGGLGHVDRAEIQVGAHAASPCCAGTVKRAASQAQASCIAASA